MTNDSNIESRPPFDSERAKDMLNKRVLIGLTYYSHDDIFVERKQMHGRIVSADERKGFAVKLEGIHEGEIYWLPPDLRGFRKAQPGEYQEHSTGEIVIDPDIISTWVVHNPPPESQTDG